MNIELKQENIVSSEMERGETESYLDLELTELDYLFCMNGF